MKYLSRRDFLWVLPLSLGLGAVLSFLQPGNRLVGWLGFSFLFLLSFLLLTMATRWARGSASTAPTAPLPRSTLGLRSAKVLKWMITLAFGLRLAGGLATYLILPINGYQDERGDDKAGYVYTDAHRRDTQAWDLASSDLPILDAFSKTYAYDQYGGLLAFSALIYRYVSPDAHRPLMLVLLSTLMAALGLPFLWKAASQQWGEKIALASCWIYALYPESVLLGGSAMREPYLLLFSVLTLWGFVEWGASHFVDDATAASASRRPPLTSSRRSFGSASLWFGLGILGMLLVSPAVALVTLIIFAGWMYFTSERGRIPWWLIAGIIAIFVAGLFILSSALDRQGNLRGETPIGIINDFLRGAVSWDVYQLERGSGRVQLIFEQFPDWLHLPFVVMYGVLQPIIIPAFIEPTTLIWRIIGILRALGWWSLLPVLIFSIVATPKQGSDKNRKLWIWITVIVWTWILFAALRGGGDQWDNPRYRTILFVWQALLAGYAWVSWRESKNPWFKRILLMEGVLLAFFGEWYADRYFQIGGKMSFGPMVALIAGLWFVIIVAGWMQDRRRAHARSNKS